jgi:hypothetical protein
MGIPHLKNSPIVLYRIEAIMPIVSLMTLLRTGSEASGSLLGVLSSVVNVYAFSGQSGPFDGKYHFPGELNEASLLLYDFFH